MTMAFSGLAKLSEELGELQQVIGKMLAYGVGQHPDGTESLLIRFEEEAADVTAALTFVAQKLQTNSEHIKTRASLKLNRFQEWDSNPNS